MLGMAARRRSIRRRCRRPRPHSGRPDVRSAHHMFARTHRRPVVRRSAQVGTAAYWKGSLLLCSTALTGRLSGSRTGAAVRLHRRPSHCLSSCAVRGRLGVGLQKFPSCSRPAVQKWSFAKNHFCHDGHETKRRLCLRWGVRGGGASPGGLLGKLAGLLGGCPRPLQRSPSVR